MTVETRTDFLPIDVTLDVKTVRHGYPECGRTLCSRAGVGTVVFHRRVSPLGQFTHPRWPDHGGHRWWICAGIVFEYATTGGREAQLFSLLNSIG
jgi:hypothetical protein